MQFSSDCKLLMLDTLYHEFCWRSCDSPQLLHCILVFRTLPKLMIHMLGVVRKAKSYVQLSDIFWQELLMEKKLPFYVLNL